MAPEAHHHRSTTKGVQKSFKSKHSTKGAIKEKLKGKVESLEKGSRKTPHQQVMSKLDRRNQAKQKRQTHNLELEKTANLFSGKNSVARHVAVISLSDSISSTDAIRNLVHSVDPDIIVPNERLSKVEIPRFKQNLQFIVPQRRDVWEALDCSRMADYVLLIMSADEEVDQLGENVLRAIESQGISTIISLVQDLEKCGAQKKQHQVQTSLKSFIQHFFASQEKVHSLDSSTECLNVIRTLCGTTPKGINWRDDRSWMLIEDIKWQDTTFSVEGTIRGRNLNVDRLMQIGDWSGVFQAEKITCIKAISSKITNKTTKPIGAEQEISMNEDLIQTRTADADDILELAPEEVVMADTVEKARSTISTDRKGVLLDDHHYFDDDEDEIQNKNVMKLPKGTSKYQAAWYLNDVSDSGSDVEDVEMDNHDEEDDGHSDRAEHEKHMADATEGAPSEYPQSEMFLDASPQQEAEQIAAYRAQKQEEARDDLEFPDEIELDPGVIARERLARYRGLKSSRNSTWDTTEDKIHEPSEWTRLLEIGNYRAAKNKYTSEALIGGISAGIRVEITFKIGNHDMTHLKSLERPLALFSLLRHEQKRTVMNYAITLSSDHLNPIRSKEELIMQCGSRRLLIRPLFSQLGHTPNNVHKFDRYLHPGQSATATVIAPLTWGSVPVLFFRPKPTTSTTEEKEESFTSDLELVGTGTSLPPSLNRIVAKRAILTGNPYKIHKRSVTIRYMFFNREDVAWFKALQLWTRRGRSGLMKEALGTHGYFKAEFDGKINPMDSVAVSLWKRVWPKWAESYTPTFGPSSIAGNENDKKVVVDTNMTI